MVGYFGKWSVYWEAGLPLRNLSQLGKQSGRNPMKIKCKAVLRRNKPMLPNTLGISQLENSLQRRTRGSFWRPCWILMYLSIKESQYLGLHCWEVDHYISVGGLFPLVSPWQDTSGVLGPLLGPSVQGRHGHTAVSTAEVTSLIKGWSTWCTGRNSEAWDCLPSGKRGYCCLQLPHGRAQKFLRLVLGTGPSLSRRLN